MPSLYSMSVFQPLICHLEEVRVAFSFSFFFFFLTCLMPSKSALGIA